MGYSLEADQFATENRPKPKRIIFQASFSHGGELLNFGDVSQVGPGSSCKWSYNFYRVFSPQLPSYKKAIYRGPITLLITSRGPPSPPCKDVSFAEKSWGLQQATKPPSAKPRFGITSTAPYSASSKPKEKKSVVSWAVNCWFMGSFLVANLCYLDHFGGKSCFMDYFLVAKLQMFDSGIIFWWRLCCILGSFFGGGCIKMI